VHPLLVIFGVDDLLLIIRVFKDELKGILDRDFRVSTTPSHSSKIRCILDETSLRVDDLHLIIRVFKDELVRILDRDSWVSTTASNSSKTRCILHKTSLG
jgi:hypothetical protein